MPGKLQGKVGIVTGAARGMGRAHALGLAREGADVALVDIGHGAPSVPYASTPSSPYALAGDDEIEGVVKKIQGLGRRAIGVNCDVSKASDVQRMVKTVIDEFGRIDILVNNAAVASWAAVIDMTEEEWDRVMNVNLKGPFLCCKYVLPHMIAQKSGKIVNISSVDAREPTQMHLHYCISKAGVEMLTKGLSKEVAVHNINVNCIGPGAVWTPLSAKAAEIFAPGMDPREFYEGMSKSISTFGREVTLEDVVNAMLFLVSEESRNLTGYTIYVDGGFKGVSL